MTSPQVDAPPATAPRSRGVLVARIVLGLAAATQVVLTAVLFRDDASGEQQPLAWAPFAVAVIALAWARLGRRAVAGLVLGVATLLQLAAISVPPQTSNDDLRYIWDGTVQLAGVSPYRHTPNDPALERLHTPELFQASGDGTCTRPTGCARLNRPDVRTIYPPVAQGAFVGVRLVDLAGLDGHGGQLAFQATGAAGVLLLTFLLLRRQRLRGEPAWWAALWAWSPLVVTEIGNNAHIDWVGVLFAYGALAAYALMRPAWAGVLLGAAIATKIYPALIGPALLKRHPWTVIGTSVAVVVLGYVPHVLAVGMDVIGYLPGYLDEEGYSSGSRLKLVGWLLPQPLDTLVGALVLVALAALCWRVSDPDHPERSAVWLVGGAFLVFTPHYGWYAVLLLALIAMTGRWHWLPVAAAGTFSYLYQGAYVGYSGLWAIAAGLTLVGWLISRRLPAGGRPVVEPVETPALERPR
ncbi:DUF2029 domain-containing protein [Nocardioides sp. TRM66260-LWL]|uniref:glycosyltransferase family 87 protein n=1 Tax=Nocardioides sp. TRM66260-LWL TaxID=2874478 RepID=UPI001CC60D79|nr:glycosyltransferase family 87 protein [Nocardioides sp. TRM66260-LWL]MBZ5735524.1 DUF2029 domain-containing protein [Nocardioides sp. TRM66260-LWL]